MPPLSSQASWARIFRPWCPTCGWPRGGQSAAGAAIDHLITLHPAHAQAAALAKSENLPLPVWLANKASKTGPSAAIHLAQGVHVVPEFLGNRAPFADPQARALIAGLGLETDLASLLTLYIAGLSGLGYGLRQIIEVQAAHGAHIRRILISGGAGSHDLVRQILADATGCPVVATEAEEPVLLGSAILGAVAAGLYPDVRQAMSGMSRAKGSFVPTPGPIGALHDRRFAAFETLQNAARAVERAGLVSGN